MKIYTQNCRERATNADYPKTEVINNTEDLLKAVSKDHIFSEMKNNHRGTDNYISNDCIVLDLDNTHSEDPGEWKTLDDIVDALPDVKFYYVQSRNYMKVKTKKKKTGEVIHQEAREKYHIYLPLAEEQTDIDKSNNLILKASALFPYFDMGAAEPAHFFFGVEDPKGGYIDGALTIDQYINQSGERLNDIIKSNIKDYADKVKNGEYTIDDNTQKAVTRLYSLIGEDTEQINIQEMIESDSQKGIEKPDNFEVGWLEEVEQKNSLAWFLDWAKRYGVKVGDQYKINNKHHPKTIVICVNCPWEDEHSGGDFPENDTVVLIDQGGKLNFLCRHSHGGRLNWKKYREKIEQAGEKSQDPEDPKSQEEEKEEYLNNKTSNHIQEFINGIGESVNTPVQTTGFINVDAALDGGLYEGLYIMGAITSLGKTTFVLQIMDQIAQTGRDVLIFSLEMARAELMSKSISRHTLLQVLEDPDGDISNAKTNRGITAGARYANYSDKEKEIIQKAIVDYSEYADHIYIHEGIGDIGTDFIKETVRKHKIYTGQTPVVLVDYLQILAPYDVRASDKQNTDKAVLELRRVSRDFKTPVIAISSLNRASYSGEVTMEAFKESGAVEYGSDVLMGLQLKGVGKKDFDLNEAKRKSPREMELVIIKHRNGQAGVKIGLNYYPLFNYFIDNGGWDNET